jgi:hypothetical protein
MFWTIVVGPHAAGLDRILLEFSPSLLFRSDLVHNNGTTPSKVHLAKQSESERRL